MLPEQERPSLLEEKINQSYISNENTENEQLEITARLNKIEGLENPSSENLCKWIWQRLIKTLPSLKKIEIRETDSTGCIYQGE